MHMNFKHFLLVWIVFSSSNQLVFAQSKASKGSEMGTPKIVHQCLEALNEVLIRDITSPPVASRNYAYTFISFYEASRYADPNAASFAGKLRDLKPFPIPQTQDLDWLTAGAWAYYYTAKNLVFSKGLFEEQWAPIELALKNACPNTDQYNRSKLFGEQTAAHIRSWYSQDGYAETRTLTRYTPLKAPGNWKQTAPAYMAGVEPNWNKIRPLTMERADQFKPVPPPPFSRDSSSAYYQDVRYVFDVSQKLSGEQKAIADFWDCNPWAAQYVGHVSYAIKKISPGGHWMGITRLAIEKSGIRMVQGLRAYSMVAVGLFDAFISCWDEKYRSNYIRPVTAIQEFFSPVWTPYLQTPPFPEYTSGHSVASKAAAVILTDLFGTSFAFNDTTEIPYGLPPRAFESFEQAAEEAALSRLYGGIHFMPAITEGKKMGAQVGMQVLRLTR